jgi:long-chain acyl-CoA synthetase
MNSVKYKDALYPVRQVGDLRELMNSSAELYAERAAYLAKDRPGGNFVPVSYRQFRADVTALGAKLLDGGLLSGKIAVISENSYEYVVIYFAVVCGGGVIVPLDPRLPRDETVSLLERAGVRAVFHSRKCANNVSGVTDDGGYAPDVICVSDLPRLIKDGKEIIRGGDDSYFRVLINPCVMCTLLFTSGTTGAAKGVVLSHANLVSNVMGMSAYISASGMTALSVLPMHHTLEFTCDVLAGLYQGCTVAICEGLRYVMRDLAAVRAEVIVGVPLVFEKMHRNIMKTAQRSGRYGLLRGLMDLAKLSEGRIPARLMFRDVHKALGGRMKLFLVGGAPCDPGIISDFNAMGIRMIQGYGMTETSPIVSVGKDRYSSDASVGLPLHGLFVQIDGADADGVGEIVVSGPSVMLGYYGDADATREAMPDGRLRTGDLGHFDRYGFLYITGRKKNVIVLKNGKNVYPEEVEYYLLKSEYVEEAVVYGAGAGAVAGYGADTNGASWIADRYGADVSVHAEIFPDYGAIERDFASRSAEDIRKVIDREVDKANELMLPHMRIRHSVLRDTPFEKTAIRKIKRT